jgi:hypothetical protein
MNAINACDTARPSSPFLHGKGRGLLTCEIRGARELAVVRAIQEAQGGEGGRGLRLILASVGGLIFWSLIFIAFA